MDELTITSHLCRLKESFLYAAARGGRVSECASLLELGADPNWVNYRVDDNHHNDPCGETSFLAAVRNGHFEVATLFLSSESALNVDMNAKTRDGETVLHLLAARGDENLWQFFAQSVYSEKCPYKAINNKGETASDIAYKKGFHHLADDMRKKEKNDNNFSLPLLRSNFVGDDSLNTEYDEEISDHNDVEEEDEWNETVENNNMLEPLDGRQIYMNSEEVYSTSDEMSTTSIGRSSSIHDDMSSEESVALSQDGTDDILLPSCTESSSFHLEPEQYTMKQDKQLNQKSINDIHHDLLNVKKDLQSIFEKNCHNLSLHDIDNVEDMLRLTVQLVVDEKEKVSKKKLEEEEEKRSCVICQVEVKSVLLMPCRHLCICKECSERDELQKCPLCRISIVERIHVYA